MITRPSQMPGVVRFDPLTDHEDARAVEAEERAGRWLERIGWLCGGMCLGCFALWLSLII